MHIDLQKKKKNPNLTDDTDHSHYKISSLKQSAVFKCMFNKEACSIDFRQESVCAARIIKEKKYSEFCLSYIYSFCIAESFHHFVKI